MSAITLPNFITENVAWWLGGVIVVFGLLIYGLRDYVKKCGFKKVALGLSGGIDSALTAYLAVKAVGPKNVLGLMMPYRSTRLSYGFAHLGTRKSSLCRGGTVCHERWRMGC